MDYLGLMQEEDEPLSAKSTMNVGEQICPKTKTLPYLKIFLNIGKQE
jgi:hypothetical protein